MASGNMDMKDLVLSTLSYLEKSAEDESGENTPKKQPLPKKQTYTITEKKPEEKSKPAPQAKAQENTQQESTKNEPKIAPAINTEKIENEESPQEDTLKFLTSLRERILVLFEGIQSPNNRNIEAKIDLILNFLEFQLSVIDNKIEKLTKEEYDAKRYS